MGARGASLWEMGMETEVQILNEFECISQSTNNLGKGMNSVILPPAKSK